MNTHAPLDFHEDYLTTWTEPDAERRRRTIERMWSPDGRLVVSSFGITLRGTEEIVKHIARVHDDMISARRLTFSYDQQLEADDALLLRWSMTAPSGEVVGRGADVVFRDSEGRVERAYMFMGVS